MAPICLNRRENEKPFCSDQSRDRRMQNISVDIFCDNSWLFLQLMWRNGRSGMTIISAPQGWWGSARIIQPKYLAAVRLWPGGDTDIIWTRNVKLTTPTKARIRHSRCLGLAIYNICPLLLAGSVWRAGRTMEQSIRPAPLKILTRTILPNPADSLSESWNLLRKGVEKKCPDLWILGPCLCISRGCQTL